MSNAKLYLILYPEKDIKAPSSLKGREILLPLVSLIENFLLSLLDKTKLLYQVNRMIRV